MEINLPNELCVFAFSWRRLWNDNLISMRSTLHKQYSHCRRRAQHHYPLLRAFIAIASHTFVRTLSTTTLPAFSVCLCTKLKSSPQPPPLQTVIVRAGTNFRFARDSCVIWMKRVRRAPILRFVRAVHAPAQTSHCFVYLWPQSTDVAIREDARVTYNLTLVNQYVDSTNG